jgi:hypothetical protein
MCVDASDRCIELLFLEAKDMSSGVVAVGTMGSWLFHSPAGFMRLYSEVAHFAFPVMVTSCGVAGNQYHGNDWHANHVLRLLTRLVFGHVHCRGAQPAPQREPDQRGHSVAARAAVGCHGNGMVPVHKRAEATPVNTCTLNFFMRSE